MLKTLYLIVGESGSGKDTVVDLICKHYGCTRLKSYTSRKPRTPDEDTHVFVSRMFILLLKNKVGFTDFNGNLYCATQKQVDSSDFYIIDIDGIKYFQEHYNGKRPYKIIYVKTDSKIRYERLIIRERLSGGTKEKYIGRATKRLINDIQAFKGVESMVDCTVPNNDGLKECVDLMWQYIQRVENNIDKTI